MVSEKLQSNKPSQDEKFANQVLFFTAVLDNDIDAVRGLIQKDATLLEAKPEWKMAIKRQYWIGSSALDLAVGYGYSDMVDLLLGMGAEVNSVNRSKMSTLHTAAIMNRPRVVNTLLSAGAKIEAKSAHKQTPLHVAAIRNRGDVVDVLLKGGAKVDAKDQHGRTPADWAALLNHEAVVEKLVGAGAEKPSGKGLFVPSMQVPELLETGIKIVDFCAPLKRGGINGVFTPYSGVGFMVVNGLIMRSIQKVYKGTVLMAGLNTDHAHEEFWDVHLRELDADHDLTYLFEQSTGKAEQPMALTERVMAESKALAKDGREVLIVFDSKLATSPEILTALKAFLAEQTSVTVLIYGHHTVGVLPSALDGLDSVLTFSMGRAKAGLYPAIDPARSTSSLFEAELKETAHAQVVSQARRLMTRYAELRFPYDAGGPETLWYIDDDPTLQETLVRARRLDRFLTQPAFGMEPWTGTLGEYVSLTDTIKGCQEILDGKYDDVEEEQLQYIGTIDEQRNKDSLPYTPC